MKDYTFFSQVLDWIRLGGIGQRSRGYDESYVLISGPQMHIIKQILNGIFICVHMGDNLLNSL